MLRAFNIWAYQSDFQVEYGLPFCEDARYNAGHTSLVYPSGNRGQAGWHIAVPFRDPTDLLVQLSTWSIDPRFGGGGFEHGEIHRLAIVAHGAPNVLRIAGKDNRARSLTAQRLLLWRRLRETLGEIGLFTAQGPRDAIDPATIPSRLPRRQDYPASFIILAGCRAAQGRMGSVLLQRLSFLWPHRTVVGFTTWGANLVNQRAAPYATSHACLEPGMIHTESRRHLSDEQWQQYRRDHLNALRADQLPWASEHAPSAKWARDGAILSGHRGGEDERGHTPEEAARLRSGTHRGRGR